MDYVSLDGQKFYNMIINGCNALNEKKEYVNSLNVFPVPDGDTGTNMYMTFRAAANEIVDLKNSDIGEIAKVLSKGALMGARGNSGVILSQIFRGIASGLTDKKEASAEELANAIAEGAKSAYKAVMRPTEGTILTVVKAAGESALACESDGISTLLQEVCTGAENMLNLTPEMLPALKKAKVVDAGGMGLLIILKGMHLALKNNLEVQLTQETVGEKKPVTVSTVEENIEFGYCTEFFIKTDKITPEVFKKEIESLGDSLIAVGADGIIKIHIHSNDPGSILSLALKHGELSKIKIDNMREQHREILEAEYKDNGNNKSEEIEEKEYAFISVSMGEGIKEIFEKELGVDHVIDGGQTMNPSTQDFLDSIKNLKAKTIFILPNNKNIIMAANQAADISDKEVIVIPTKTITQGVTALTTFNSAGSIEDNVSAMNDAKDRVKSGFVTYAVRDTEIDGLTINTGDILGLIENKIVNVGKNPSEVCQNIIKEMVDGDSELISIYKGSDVTEDDCDTLTGLLEEEYSELDILSYDGKQPLYYYIVSVE
ncbi:MAG: DAK2 domain-containing protein [Clostridiaceae bacterium]